MLALDMGRLRFASEALPSPSASTSTSASMAPALPRTALGGRAAEAEAEAACDGEAEGVPFGGAASAGGRAGAGAGDEEEVLRQRRHYDTFDVEMREMQAPPLNSNHTPNPNPSPGPSLNPNPSPSPDPYRNPNPYQALLLPRGSNSLVAPPPDAVIVQSFHVVLRLQRRLAAPPPLLAGPPLPRWRLGLRLSPALHVRLSATQYCQLRGLAATLQPPRPTPAYDAEPSSPSSSPPTTPTTTPTALRPPRAPHDLVGAEGQAGAPPLGAASERRVPPPLSRQGSSRLSQGSAASLEETIETI